MPQKGRKREFTDPISGQTKIGIYSGTGDPDNPNNFSFDYDEPRPEIAAPQQNVQPTFNRAALLSKIPGGNFLLGPEAIRGYGTQLGAAGGGILGATAAGYGAIPGMALGGYIGNRLTNEAQSWMPELLGEPSDSGISTAALDSVSNLVGMGLGKALPKITGLLKSKNRKELLAKLLSHTGESLDNQLTTYALNPNYQTNLRKSVTELQKAGMPMSGGQVTGGPLALELEKTAKSHIPLVKSQTQFIQKEAKNLINASGKLNAIEQENLTRQGLGEAAVWLEKKSSPFATYIAKTGRNPEEVIKQGVSSLADYKDFTKLVGAPKAQTILFKDALENSLGADGMFDPIKLYGQLRGKRDQFNFIAKELERLGHNSVKASDLKASWNRFTYANLIAARGKDISPKAMEIAATQAGITGILSIPLLGLASYPAWRAIATGGKITFVGKYLGKAFSDPEVVEMMMRMTTSKSPATAKNAFRKFADWSWKNGVPFTTIQGAEYYVNPQNLQPVPADQYTGNEFN